MSLQGLIKVFVAFKTQKECSANSLLCLVGVCFHSESSSSSNSREQFTRPVLCRLMPGIQPGLVSEASREGSRMLPILLLSCAR